MKHLHHDVVPLLLVCCQLAARPTTTRAVSDTSVSSRWRGRGRKGRAESLMSDSLPRSERRMQSDEVGKELHGDPSCPCLTHLQLTSNPPIPHERIEVDLGPNINLATYGINCAPHDMNGSMCSPRSNCVNEVPLPPDCERSHCNRSWCYIDSDNCAVANERSHYIEGRHYSYATCGDMNSFTSVDSLLSLRGKSLRVAFNSNSGGWQGAYNRDGHFANNHLWEGPVVEFVQKAAFRGQYALNKTAPPDWLREKSWQFFGSSSRFDLCIYAASLGYLDLCVGSYTITDKRASVATFFETRANPIYLITFETDQKTDWDSFYSSFKTIFQPFTMGSWLLIVIFFLPVLGLLMLFHEYDAPGSAYPRKVPVVRRNERTGQREYRTRKVRLGKHIVRSLYMAFLAFAQESYNQSVVTPGGKANLLAISSFVLLVVAVYTANLAAILTTDISSSSVVSVEEAIMAGYNFCSERKVAEIVMGIHNVNPDMIVPDPVSLGGDGRAGFDCSRCNARDRVFDQLRLKHDDSSLYCNAAFALWEDLQVLHGQGKHCDKQRIGEALAYQNVGFPLSEKWSKSLLTLFHQVRNEGVMDLELAAAEPGSSCPIREGEGNSLTVRELTGVWVIASSLAFFALLVKLVNHYWRKKKDKEKESRAEEQLQQYDQWGNPTSHEVFVDGKTYHPDSVRELAKTLEGSDKQSIMLTISEEDIRDNENEGSDQSSVRSGAGLSSNDADCGGLKHRKDQWQRLHSPGKETEACSSDSDGDARKESSSVRVVMVEKVISV